jgi:predicted DCC family thiol-disulfide oxidoreductase YuxK
MTTNPEIDRSTQPALVFFDGVCGLCNFSVDFLCRHDRHGRLQFAPLQGETARARLHLAPGENNFNSIVLIDAEGTFRRSDAVWRALNHLGGVWRLAATLLWLVPRPLRNWGYDLVARHRYRLFGRKESCRMPTAAERSRFLP